MGGAAHPRAGGPSAVRRWSADGPFAVCDGEHMNHSVIVS